MGIVNYLKKKLKICNVIYGQHLYAKKLKAQIDNYILVVCKKNVAIDVRIVHLHRSESWNNIILDLYHIVNILVVWLGFDLV